MKHAYRVVALPGEGIGPEVVAATVSVLNHVSRIAGIPIEIEVHDFGIPAYEKHGSYFPEETARHCEDSDGILLGAVERGGLLEIRKHFDLFANLRPVKTVDCLHEVSCLKEDVVRDVDILFVRELTGGIYFGPSDRREDERGPYGFHTMSYYDSEIRRIARVALEFANNRRKRLTVAHKENGLPKIPWCDLVQQEAKQFPEVTVETMLADTLGAKLVMEPRSFDTVLSGNLMGDWISSIGGALAGSIGVLPSASLNSGGFGLYESVHGTAPELANQGVANPMGTIGAAVLMLEQWGQQELAKLIDHAQWEVIRKGYRTPDIASGNGDRIVSTQEMSDQIIAEISEA